MTKQYSIEFAVEAKTELKAMDLLKRLGVPDPHSAKLNDLDRQAGLFIIRIRAEEKLLTDDMYKNISKSKKAVILSDELSEKRSKIILQKTLLIENQLKRLLMFVLPETEMVMGQIIKKYQKHKTKRKPRNRIEWCREIQNFSFGELIAVLNVDVSQVYRNSLPECDWLLQLITSSGDFDDLKSKAQEVMEPKTIWELINSLLENPVEYTSVKDPLSRLCGARNDAAHIKSISLDQLKNVRKDEKYINQYISSIKSDYSHSLTKTMESVAKSVASLLEMASKIYPDAIANFTKTMRSTFSPMTNGLVSLGLSYITPNLSEIIKNNTRYQEETAKMAVETMTNMAQLDGWKEAMNILRGTDFSQYFRDRASEAKDLNSMMKIIAKKKRELISDRIIDAGKNLSQDEAPKKPNNKEGEKR